MHYQCMHAGRRRRGRGGGKGRWEGGRERDKEEGKMVIPRSHLPFSSGWLGVAWL